MYGYNNVGSNYRRVFEFPNYRTTVLNSLLQIPPDRKVLRFPDGQESINNNSGFDDDFTNDFIQFCLAGGVEKVVLRADFKDVEGSVRTYGLLREHLNVVYVEASNEPYYGANLTINNFWELLESIFNPLAYHRRKATQYANKTLNLYQAFLDQYGTEIVPKFAFACPVPHVAKYEQWYNVLFSKLHMIRNMVLHIYGTPKEQTVDSLQEWLNYTISAIQNKIDPHFNLICTEYSALHFGKDGKQRYTGIAHTPLHETMHFVAIDQLSPIFSLIMLHKYMGEDVTRMFGKIIVEATTGNVLRHSRWLE